LEGVENGDSKETKIGNPAKYKIKSYHSKFFRNYAFMWKLVPLSNFCTKCHLRGSRNMINEIYD